MKCNNVRAQEIYYILWQILIQKQIQIQLQKLKRFLKRNATVCNIARKAQQIYYILLHLNATHIFTISRWEIYHFMLFPKITKLRSARKNNANLCYKCRWSFVESICFKLSLSAINIRCCVIGNIGEAKNCSRSTDWQSNMFQMHGVNISENTNISNVDKYILSTVFNGTMCSISNIGVRLKCCCDAEEKHIHGHDWGLDTVFVPLKIISQLKRERMGISCHFFGICFQSDSDWAESLWSSYLHSLVIFSDQIRQTAWNFFSLINSIW